MKFDENALDQVLEDARREVMKDMRREVDEADVASRAARAGFPEQVVLAEAANALPVDLPPDVLADCSHTVAHGEPFEFVVAEGRPGRSVPS